MPSVLQIPLKFVNPAQKEFVENPMRNQCFNGGYGNGKTYAGCMKLILLGTKFPKSRWVIGRWRYKDLMQTTAQTFFKLCAPELYDPKNGGRYVEGKGYLKLTNGTEYLFMHFDDLDENSIKSLECNGILLDQAEEIGENIYLHLDARVGRWDMGEVPQDLLDADPNWPRNKLTNRPIVPQYSLLLCNPADEGELHWIWQRFHPDSPEWQQKYQKTNFYIEATSRENLALSGETLDAMESRDEVWKARFIEGKWGKSGGQIHTINADSILDVDDSFVRSIIRKGNLYRAYDHGGPLPACCLWISSFEGNYFVYREYYQSGMIISDHRKNISELSGYINEKGQWIREDYLQNVADPEIFVKKQQNRGGFWCTADEYLDNSITDSNPIAWTPADNNEMATRNRISELLRIQKHIKHPITGELGAPKLYFIKRNEHNPYGCVRVIAETKAQKYKLLDTVNGKPIFSSERDDKIADHGYDPLRYFCAIHAQFPTEPKKKASEHSFRGMQNRLKALKISGYYKNFAMPK